MSLEFHEIRKQKAKEMQKDWVEGDWEKKKLYDWLSGTSAKSWKTVFAARRSKTENVFNSETCEKWKNIIFDHDVTLMTHFNTLTFFSISTKTFAVNEKQSCYAFSRW